MKRTLDVVLVMMTAPLWIPLGVALGVVVLLRLGTPVWFAQRRPGIGGRPFTMIKFRTMTVACGPDGVLLPDGDRLTGFGRWLRATSLDELPELINVLRGEMSLVGPRPLLIEYLTLYSPEQSRRHDVRPGITGWAQVNGRNGISWEEKFALDAWYVDHQTIVLDLLILWRTMIRVVGQHDISAKGEATMSRFDGSQ